MTKSPSLRAVGGSPPRLPSANWPRPASPGRGQFFMTARREPTSPRNRARAPFSQSRRRTQRRFSYRWHPASSFLSCLILVAQVPSRPPLLGLTWDSCLGSSPRSLRLRGECLYGLLHPDDAVSNARPLLNATVREVLPALHQQVQAAEAALAAAALRSKHAQKPTAASPRPLRPPVRRNALGAVLLTAS
jgi:hypothetical protein